jgi:hypothetical protein
MPEEQVSAAAEFRGVSKRIAPHMLPQGISPDCENCRPYLGLLGRLGPRSGRSKLNSTAYPGELIGIFMPPNEYLGTGGNEDMIVAIDDGNSVTLSPEAGPWSGGSSWGGPTLTSINYGFATTVTVPTQASPAPSAALNVDTKGANKAVAGFADITLSGGTSGSISIYLTFNNGIGRQLACTCIISGTSGGLSLTTTNFLIDITGATRLTLVDVTGTDDGNGAPQVGGIITVAGSKV